MFPKIEERRVKDHAKTTSLNDLVKNRSWVTMVLSASNEAIGFMLEGKIKSPARIVDGAQYSKPKPTSQVGSAFLFAARCVLYYNT
jgi:hypothetical protein